MELSWKVGADCLWRQGSGRLWFQRESLWNAVLILISNFRQRHLHSRSTIVRAKPSPDCSQNIHSRIFRYIHFPARRKINALCLLSSEQHVCWGSERESPPAVCAPFALTELCNLIRHRSLSFPTLPPFEPRKLFLPHRERKLW